MVLVLFLVFPTWTVTYGSLDPVLSFAWSPCAQTTIVTTDKERNDYSKESTVWLTLMRDHWRCCDTCDGDLRGPLGGAVQHALLDGLHLLSMNGFADDKNLPDELKDFWFVPLPDLHPVFHGHNNILSPVFSSVLGALLRSTWTFFLINILKLLPAAVNVRRHPTEPAHEPSSMFRRLYSRCRQSAFSSSWHFSWHLTPHSEQRMPWRAIPHSSPSHS